MNEVCLSLNDYRNCWEASFSSPFGRLLLRDEHGEVDNVNDIVNRDRTMMSTDRVTNALSLLKNVDRRFNRWFSS